MDDTVFVYFVNSQGKRAILSSSRNCNYWELMGRSGFTAPEVEVFSEKMASGATVYLGKSVKARECSMRMVCRGQSTAERDHIFFDMLGVLLDVDGTGEGKLYVRRSDGAMVYLNCVYSGGMDIAEEYQKLHLFTLSFYAADPCFYRDGEVIEATLDGADHTFTINNRTAYNTSFRLQAASGGLAMKGGIINETTNRKLTLANGSTGVAISPELFVFLSKFKKEIYTMGTYGIKRPAANLFDWNQSDADFSAITGENEFTYNFQGGTSSSFVKFRFDEVSLGV